MRIPKINLHNFMAALAMTVWFCGCGSLLAAFGLSTSTDFYTVDTGSTPNLVFKIRRTNNGSSTQSPGDIASLVYNGIEYQNQSKGSHLNSGFDFLGYPTSNVTVSAAAVGTDFIKVTVVGSPGTELEFAL